MIAAGEVVDLRLPDPSHHHPARLEDDGRAASRLQIVQPDAIAGDKVGPVDAAGDSIRRHQQRQKPKEISQHDEPGLLAASDAAAVCGLGKCIPNGGALLAAREIGFKFPSTLDATPFCLLPQLILALAGDFKFFEFIFDGSHFAIDTLA